MADQLAGLSIFIAVADTRSFRAASEQLGVTRSAISQGIRRFEDRLSVTLVQRTTRSVHLTEAGERLYAAVNPALAEVTNALNRAGDQRKRPSGRLRLTVSSIADGFLNGSTLAAFLDAFPDIRIDVTVSDEEFDIVAEGFDAGVRLGEVIEQDMIAVSVTGDQRQLVVGAPDYVGRRGVPQHPSDLPTHACIGWRADPTVAPYRWDFTEKGRNFAVDVDPVMTTNDMGLMIRMAIAGGGLTFGLEETFRPYLAEGKLVAMLEEYLPPFPGFFIYYPKRRHVPPKLRALVDYLRLSGKLDRDNIIIRASVP